MTDLSTALTHDHHEIDGPIDAWATGSADRDRAALDRAVHDLRAHIFTEEQVLFPVLRQAGAAMPVMVMIREHAAIWQLLDALDATRDDDERVGELCRQVAALLADHNAKEEQILYPMADRVVDPEDGVAVLGLFEMHDLPEGWVCQGLA